MSKNDNYNSKSLQNICFLAKINSLLFVRGLKKKKGVKTNENLAGDY